MTPRSPAPARAALVLAALTLAAATPTPHALPPIVFVSRQPPTRPGDIPGLGPGGRALATGGRLMLRAPDGALRELLPPAALYDVSRPSVSPDGRRVAFAGTPAADGAWRLWIVGLDGAGLAAATHDPAPPLDRRCDDLDPCWVDDSTLCFASTRFPLVAQYGGGPVTNLFVMRLPGGEPVRVTSERNGAETPAMDVRTGRIVFARWWHNRYRASADPSGLTTDPARVLPGDSVSLWHAMEIALDRARDERLACGDPASRLGAECYQPAILADGSIVGVYAANSGLVPASGGTGIQRFSPRLRAGRRLAGAIVEPGGHAGYGSPRGLAPPSACSPAGLPDGRMLFAYDPGGRGDFGLYVMNADGSGLARVLDLPRTLELDPAPVVARPRAPGAAWRPGDAPPDRPFPSLDQALASPRRFRFLDQDVFAPPGSPPRTSRARIRFYATLPRPSGPDSVILVREAAVGPGGRVDQDGLPADLPMFEQIVDGAGRVLRAAHGPAHVAGFNAGAPGQVTRCTGCHVGHSTLLRRGGR
ncbi:MAG TPA: hypothetical protein VI792_02730 [Candidatus Eisenbacteria bacterium]